MLELVQVYIIHIGLLREYTAVCFFVFILGGSAFVLGELFPEAWVVGIDLAPPYIRFCRAHKELRGAQNVDFSRILADF